MINKMQGLLIYLIIGFVIPLSGSFRLLFHPKIIIILLGCIIIILTQPALDAREAKDKSQTDKNSFWMIMLLSMIGLIAPIIEWGYFIQNKNVVNVITVIGVILICVGLVIRVWSIRLLGNHFTATVQILEGHKLIRQGPYKIIRHPSYLGAYMAFIGSGLLLNVFWGILIASIAMGVAYYKRITVEEETLTQFFGLDYLKYKEETKMLIPFIW